MPSAIKATRTQVFTNTPFINPQASPNLIYAKTAGKIKEKALEKKYLSEIEIFDAAY